MGSLQRQVAFFLGFQLETLSQILGFHHYFWVSQKPSNFAPWSYTPSLPSSLHYATHDIRLTHGHRKLRLAEDFEIFRLTPDFEILRLTCNFKTLRLTPARRQPDASQTQLFEIRRQAEDFVMLRLTPDFETLRLTCDFKTLRLTPARRPPDAHQTPARRNFLKSGVRRKILKFQNHASDVIFWNNASDVQYKSSYVSLRLSPFPASIMIDCVYRKEHSVTTRTVCKFSPSLPSSPLPSSLSPFRKLMMGTTQAVCKCHLHPFLLLSLLSSAQN